MAELFVPVRPESVNAERKLSHRARGEHTAAMREASRLLAGEISHWRLKLLPVLVIATPFQRGGILADTGNHYPSVKAAIDGLVDAGWMPDDTPAYVAGILMLPPLRPAEGAPSGLHLRVVPAEHHRELLALTFRPIIG